MAVFLVGIEIKSVFEKADQKFSNAAVDEFLLLKNLAKTLGPAKLKDVIEVLEETKKQKDELKAEEKAKKEKEKEEKKKKKEEEKLKKKELDEVKKIEELRKQLLELEQGNNIIIKPVSKRGRKKKITTEDTNNDDRG
jgi:predicted nucleotidyltransferase